MKITLGNNKYTFKTSLLERVEQVAQALSVDITDKNWFDQINWDKLEGDKPLKRKVFDLMFDGKVTDEDLNELTGIDCGGVVAGFFIKRGMTNIVFDNGMNYLTSSINEATTKRLQKVMDLDTSSIQSAKADQVK